MKKQVSLSYSLFITVLVLLLLSSCDAFFNYRNTPILLTCDIREITPTTAHVVGKITSDGGALVTSRGVCWNSNAVPTIEDNKITNGTGTGVFESTIRGLEADTQYFVRTFAENSEGIAYGNIIVFMTGVYNSFADPRDGRVYKTIRIGKQTWMAENLKYLPQVLCPDPGSSIVPYYYVYAYNSCDANEAKKTDNYQIYGVLYNWEAAKIACPPGWHLPTDEEWTELCDYLGGMFFSAAKLKESGSKHWYSPNSEATNISGFTALPGGYRSDYGNFLSLGNNGRWWTATEHNAKEAWYRSVYYNHNYTDRDYGSKVYGYSVRCVKDN